MAELAAASDPATVIDRAADLPPEARALKAELARYRALAAAGGWPRITGDTRTTLEPGTIDAARVPAAARAPGRHGPRPGRRAAGQQRPL